MNPYSTDNNLNKEEKYRSQARIIADILEILLKEEKATSTKLLSKSNLSSIRLKKYITHLESNKLIKSITIDNKQYYVITDKGKNYIYEFKKFQSFSEIFGITI
jgi:predicted transcriptional regulator